MLKSPKAAAFTENFVGQWLGLREIDATIPSHILYPEYDEMLRASMLKETYLFWSEVLNNDLSLTNFVQSNFTMLNGRLAKHYGIPGIDGWEFKKVTLPKDSHRGGVLTMASVLKVTANGTYTSPILRGAWVLERILGTPPPRPPEGISAVEPSQSASSSPSIGRLPRVQAATPKSIRPDLRWRASTSSVVGETITEPAATARRSWSTAAACPTSRARRWTPRTCCRTARSSATSTSSSNCF